MPSPPPPPPNPEPPPGPSPAWAQRLERETERAGKHAERAAERATRHAERAAERATRHSRDEEPADGDGLRAEQSFSLDGVTAVTIDQTAGKLTVRPCREGETPGVVASGSKSPPKIEVRRVGDRLTVEVKMLMGWLFRRRQGATTLVRLSDGLAALKVDVGFGDVLVRDIVAADMEIDVGAGEIRTVALAGRLRVDVGAGRVSITEHTGEVRGNTGTGDLVIDIATALPGEYHAETGIGRAEVRLPPGERVNARLSSGLGRSKNEYPAGGEDSPIQVRLSTGVGEAVLKTRDAKKGEDRSAPAATAMKAQRTPGRAAPAMRWREAEQLRVLQMLEQGKVSAQEAADLIAALQGSSARPEGDEPDGDDERPVDIVT